MAVNPSKYRPPHIDQHGVDTTLDDCSSVATAILIGVASAGEYLISSTGREMGKAQLHALVRRQRRSVNDTEGGLTIKQRQEICVQAGYPKPLDINLTFQSLKSRLRSRKYVFSVGGNPSKISGPSPLKRCDCSHEWAVVDIRTVKGQDELLVYDPLRPAPPNRRGEWVPAVQVRQMAFKDSDGELNIVLQYPRGRWQKFILATKELEAEVDDLDDKNAQLTKTVKTQRKTIAALEAQVEVPVAQLMTELQAVHEHEQAALALLGG